MNVQTEPTSLTKPTHPTGSRGGAALWLAVAGLILDSGRFGKQYGVPRLD